MAVLCLLLLQRSHLHLQVPPQCPHGTLRTYFLTNAMLFVWHPPFRLGIEYRDFGVAQFAQLSDHLNGFLAGSRK